MCALPILPTRWLAVLHAGIIDLDVRFIQKDEWSDERFVALGETHLRSRCCHMFHQYCTVREWTPYVSESASMQQRTVMHMFAMPCLLLELKL